MRNMIRCGVVFAALLCVGTAFAQNSNSGDIRGTVTDTSGGVVPGVTVTALDVDKALPPPT